MGTVCTCWSVQRALRGPGQAPGDPWNDALGVPQLTMSPFSSTCTLRLTDNAGVKRLSRAGAGMRQAWASRGAAHNGGRCHVAGDYAQICPHSLPCFKPPNCSPRGAGPATKRYIHSHILALLNGYVTIVAASGQAREERRLRACHMHGACTCVPRTAVAFFGWLHEGVVHRPTLGASHKVGEGGGEGSSLRPGSWAARWHPLVCVAHNCFALNAKKGFRGRRAAPRRARRRAGRNYAARAGAAGGRQKKATWAVVQRGGKTLSDASS